MRGVLAEQDQTATSLENVGEHNVNQPIHMVYTDLIEHVCPKLLGGFLYTHKVSDEHHKLLAMYYTETMRETVNTA